jgi:hypothetical protein
VTRQLSRVRRIYDADPAGYHRGMAVLTQRLLMGRRQRVGEMVRGRLLDVGFGTGLSLPYYSSDVEVVGIERIVRRAGVQVESVDRWLLGFFNLIIGRAL